MRLKRLGIAAALIFTALLFASCSAMGDKSAKDGKLLYQKGNYSEALESLFEAEKNGIKKFDRAELYNCIGNCYYHMGDYEKCIEYQNKCLENDPEYFSGWVNLGVAYKKSGESDKAMTCYEMALNFDNGGFNESGLLYISLGSIYIEQGKPISAITYLEKARDFYRGENGEYNSSTVYAYLSIAYKMALEPEKSADAFQKASELGYPNIDEVQERLDELDKDK